MEDLRNGFFVAQGYRKMDDKLDLPMTGFRILSLALLLVSPLFAQHYQGRDHMIFHRSPALAKRSLSMAPGVGAGMHTAEATRRRELTVASRADKPVRNSAQSSAKTK